ncbi:MAG TPA: PilT/PilU family type 4a pilus ATPase [Candidatus Sumerlaeota bacterium]|nr:PilT/PilU family type 4a pilus ATPase [Candidatus Sumerlaeota bacterium]HOR29015.1 PilT/PilU family type 4a pilus ATPase [Candidatus Sumerlaeota bacterium]HPK01834.1 PilT/PilU family type 4a pilus ATPase [Candidatus Sumerlaeota bacterium]
MALNIKALVEGAYTHNASDIHVVQDSPTFVRIDGHMRPVSNTHVTKEDIEELLRQIMPAEVSGDLQQRRGADFAWQPDERMRFRVSAYYERDRLRLVMRLIRIRIATIDDLGLPEVLKTIASWHRGITLMTGVTGSGKSTTLAAMIDYINSRESRCIITIEDPIEMVHTNKKSLISQREVGRDVESFRHGLVQALRQDPDVILIGEMRDPETISTALRAAETGHYVFSTMHTSNALHTVERILSEFSEEEHALLRDQLANNLKATITQRLVRRKGGVGRVAALEIMVVNDMIRKLLLENQIPSIATVIRERRDGNVLFDQFLADLVRSETIDEAEAYQYVEDEAAFRRYVKGRLATADRGGIIG